MYTRYLTLVYSPLVYTPYLTLKEVADSQVRKSLLLHGLRIIQFHLRADTWEEVQYIVVPTFSGCTNPQSGRRVYNSNTVALNASLIPSPQFVMACSTASDHKLEPQKLEPRKAWERGCSEFAKNEAIKCPVFFLWRMHLSALPSMPSPEQT